MKNGEELRKKLIEVFGEDAISSEYPGSEDGTVHESITFGIPDTKLTLQLKEDKEFIQFLD